VRLGAVQELNPTIRLDSDFFNKAALHYLARIKKGSSSVRTVVEMVQHPVEVLREYENSGLLTIMAKNIRDNRIDMNDLRFMLDDLLPVVSKNDLHFGDILRGS